MSNYLLKSDFERFITLTNLDGITDTTDSIWEIELLSTIEVVSSYLRFRYDTDKEFKPIETHVPANTYLTGDSVIDGTDLYFAIQDVPGGTLITNTAFWKKSDSINLAIVKIVVFIIL